MTGGDPRVRDFYDRRGWTERDGQTEDARLFHPRERGKLRDAIDERRRQSTRAYLAEAGPPLRLIEAGCGGNPATELLPLCSHYTGVDFSATGLQLAEQRLAAGPVPFDLALGDVCELPFADGSFDAGYSAHVFYHLDSETAQARALQELCRVVRPGGRVVLILANPRPLAYPVRLAVRVLAEQPHLARGLRRLRPPSPLPYRPMPLDWMRRRLEPYGHVRLECFAMESTWVAQHLSEKSALGRIVLRTTDRIETRHPARAVRLGNYVRIILSRN